MLAFSLVFLKQDKKLDRLSNIIVETPKVNDDPTHSADGRKN